VPRSSWDTLVVTLEPCSSFGKTPPCTDAIRASGIRRVVVGALDPDPRHRGAGLKQLQEAGIEVEYVPNASPLEKLAPHFLRWVDVDRIRRARPWTIRQVGADALGPTLAAARHRRRPLDQRTGLVARGPRAARTRRRDRHRRHHRAEGQPSLHRAAAGRSDASAAAL
jgi:diaminohydroxyphosphoribosylaminopyrimidine deaminase/5-amino-6-(5-phosphoribosylamino)uracil reductase